jgi:hypothetical protein
MATYDPPQPMWKRSVASVLDFVSFQTSDGNWRRQDTRTERLVDLRQCAKKDELVLFSVNRSLATDV